MKHPLQVLSHSICYFLHWLCKPLGKLKNSQGGGLRDLSLLSEILATDAFWSRVGYCFQLYIKHPNKWKWIVPNLRSHRWSWLKSVGHKRKQKVMYVGKGSWVRSEKEMCKTEIRNGIRCQYIECIIYIIVFEKLI